MRAHRGNKYDGRKITRILLAAVLCCCFIALAQLPTPQADKKSSEVYKNVQVLKDVPSDQLIPSMKFIAAALGVHCEYCHVENAFDKDDKKPKQTARKMMQMMFSINANNFDGHQEVTCYSCHRGNPKPQAIPAITDTATKMLNEPLPEIQPNPPDLPKPLEIVDRYIAAKGGIEALSKLTSLHEQGSMDAGGRKFPIERSIKAPARIATITHFPSGDGKAIFDGSAGWMFFPGSAARPMTAGEADSNRMDADLHFGPDMKTLFAELRVENKVKVGDRDAILLTGRRAGLPPVDMYFDAETALLTRIVRYESSALGLNPSRIDYSDYRDVAGVKIPFHWISAAPTGRFVIQITSAEANPAIRDEVFAKPSATPTASNSP